MKFTSPKKQTKLVRWKKTSKGISQENFAKLKKKILK